MNNRIEAATESAANIVIWIRHFYWQCERAEETDIGEIWDGLLAAEESLIDLIDATNPTAAQRLREETSAIAQEYQEDIDDEE